MGWRCDFGCVVEKAVLDDTPEGWSVKRGLAQEGSNARLDVLSPKRTAKRSVMCYIEALSTS
jgi:hypothetical protein